MNHDDVQMWLDDYVKAWETYDPALVGDLFSENAQYRYRPWDDPIVGRATIVEARVNPGPGVSQRDEPGTFTATYEPFAVDGERAVATGVTTYWTDASQAQASRVYHNVYLLEFDDAGQCRSFTEHYMESPAEPPA
ncbi:MAG TPA: hypothetical protein VIM30_18325 [Candidatus Limnocylindrales bacterium]